MKNSKQPRLPKRKRVAPCPRNELNSLPLPHKVRRMEKKEKRFAFLLLFINMLMLAVTLVPHHHHHDGAICMRPDLYGQHPATHHAENDSCCDYKCLTRFQSPQPPQHPTDEPTACPANTLFAYIAPKHLTYPLPKQHKGYRIYKEPLYQTLLYQTSCLRAPPCLRFS